VNRKWIIQVEKRRVVVVISRQVEIFTESLFLFVVSFCFWLTDSSLIPSILLFH